MNEQRDLIIEVVIVSVYHVLMENVEDMDEALDAGQFLRVSEILSGKRVSIEVDEIRRPRIIPSKGER